MGIFLRSGYTLTGGTHMELWLWKFWTYSFLGLLLEKAYAAVGPRRGGARRCCLLLPLCPVYGLGVTAVLLLPQQLTQSPLGMALWGGLTATAVEYGVHVWYEYLLGVRFWDYQGVWGNLRGRVCVPFSLAWGFLLAAVLPGLEQVLTPLLEKIPPEVTYAALLVFTADALLSSRVLLRAGDPEAVRVPLVRMREKRAA